MIEIKKCSKSFGSVKAVDKVSLEIGEREVFVQEKVLFFVWRQGF